MRRIAIGLLPAVALGGVLLAHDFSFTETRLYLEEGRFAVEMVCDLDALALGVSPEVDSSRLKGRLQAMPPGELNEAIERLRRLFRRRVRVRFDGDPADFRVAFPEYGTPLAEKADIPTLLGTVARLEGAIPEDARDVSFFASRAFPPVRLGVYREGGEEPSSTRVLQSGARSDPIPLDAPAPPPGKLEVFRQYLFLGFWHIVPEGLDHILFVLGLYLLCARFRPLLWQVTAFTAAHTITLALSMYEVVSLPPRPVETLIALSIVYVAVENVFTSELKPWRVAVVFGFGLLHGLGFAGVLRELGLPEGEYVTALLSFNAGVEVGQLAVILAAFAAMGWLRGRKDYRRMVVVPLSLAIAAIGGYWAVTRGMG